MLGMLTSLTKAAIGAVIETPLAIAADVVTLGGALVERDEPFTASALSRVIENVSDATDA